MTALLGFAPLDSYYDNIYDPSFFGRDCYFTDVGGARAVTRRAGHIDWTSWEAGECSSDVARYWFALLDEIAIPAWDRAIPQLGIASWSLIALLHAEQHYRAGAYDMVHRIAECLRVHGTTLAASKAEKLVRALEALVLLDPGPRDGVAGTELSRIVEDAVEFVCAEDGVPGFTTPLRNLVRVEMPVREDFLSRRLDLSKPADVLKFYQTTYSYVLELTAANHQVETLSNYQQCLDIVFARKKKRMYDHGGGIATLALLAQKRGLEYVTLAELIGHTLEFAEKRIKKLDAAINTVTLDGIKVEVPVGTDVICCTEVVEHVFEPEKLIRELAGRLSDDGLLILSESFDYTEQFCTHLPLHQGKGGKNFVRFMSDLGFERVPATTNLHCQVYERA
jgi:hypothetical protein